MRSMKKTCPSKPYVEWKFEVWRIAKHHPFTRSEIWCCRIDLIGEMPNQVLDAGTTPLEALERALGLALNGRAYEAWISRN